MDHASTHGDGMSKDYIQQLISTLRFYRVDPSFRKSEVDRSGEVQGCGRRFANVYVGTSISAVALKHTKAEIHKDTASLKTSKCPIFSFLPLNNDSQ